MTRANAGSMSRRRAAVRGASKGPSHRGTGGTGGGLATRGTSGGGATAGFDMAMVAHAYAVLDAYIYGFALTKMTLPFDAATDMTEMAETVLAPFPVDKYPNLVAFITDHAMKPGYDFADEFEYGLDVVLGGLGAANASA